MKTSKIFIAVLILFILVNIQSLWETWFGVWIMIVIILMIVVFFILIMLLLYRLYKYLRKGEKNSTENVMLIFSICMLIAIFLFPHGIITTHFLEKRKAKIIAVRECVASGSEVLYLRDDNTFKSRKVCFGVYKYEGTYKIENDTIHFYSDTYPMDFGIIEDGTIQCRSKDGHGFFHFKIETK